MNPKKGSSISNEKSQLLPLKRNFTEAAPGRRSDGEADDGSDEGQSDQASSSLQKSSQEAVGVTSTRKRRRKADKGYNLDGKGVNDGASVSPFEGAQSLNLLGLNQFCISLKSKV